MQPRPRLDGVWLSQRIKGKMIVSQLHFLSLNLIDWAEEKSAMDLHWQVEKFWAAEFYGFGNAGDGAYSIEDKKALEILKSSTKLRQGRYEIGFLWRTNSSQLLNNRRRD